MDGRDLTQARAASLLNEKQAVISRWLLGVMPRIDKAVRIERLTGVPVTDWAKS
jgi:transcriptional regulator with XRE-family HTH domain